MSGFTGTTGTAVCRAVLLCCLAASSVGARDFYEMGRAEFFDDKPASPGGDGGQSQGQDKNAQTLFAERDLPGPVKELLDTPSENTARDFVDWQKLREQHLKAALNAIATVDP